VPEMASFGHLNKRLHVDIWIEKDHYILAIELKYKTRALQVRVGNELYALRSQTAQDLSRYDFIKDIGRVENFVTDRAPRASGYVILVTNDPSYWRRPRSYNTADARFRLHEGNTLRGDLGWGPARLKAQSAGGKIRSSSEDPTPCGGRTIRAWLRALTVGFATSSWRSRTELPSRLLIHLSQEHTGMQ